MGNKLIDKLANLTMEEKSLRRCLDIKYYDDEKRTQIFARIDKCKKEIEKVKFKIRMERKLNDKNSNTNKSNN